MNKSEPAASHRATERDLDQWHAAKYGPFFTWGAIKDCIRDNKEFPDCVKDYLVGCADRMHSDRARLSKDASKESHGFSDSRGSRGD